MDSKMAPQYVSLFAVKLESDILATCSIKTLAYCRYMDDIPNPPPPERNS